jgi:di/tricarboxylate transporter
MVLAASLTQLSILTVALVAAVAMVALRCCTMAEARRSIDWSVLIVIGSAIGIGAALDQSQAAATIAHGLLSLAGGNPLMALVAGYLATVFCTELITNNAAAVLMFPIAINAATELGISPSAFVIVVMIAASASFLSPFGYQTNMMVYGVGGYRVADYIKFGLPLSLIVFAVTILIVPALWPLN